jgi:hypothetical protein
MLLLLTHRVVFSRAIGGSSILLNMPILINSTYLHLETPKLQEVFLSKTNTSFAEKKCARCFCF